MKASDYPIALSLQLFALTAGLHSLIFKWRICTTSSDMMTDVADAVTDRVNCLDKGIKRHAGSAGVLYVTTIGNICSKYDGTCAAVVAATLKNPFRWEHFATAKSTSLDLYYRIFLKYRVLLFTAPLYLNTSGPLTNFCGRIHA